MNKKTLILILIFFLIGFSIIYINSKKGDEGLDGSREEVKLYYATDDAMYLQAELREIIIDDKSTKYKETMEELIKGPESSNLIITIPEDVEVLDIKLEDKIAYISFNQALVNKHWGGSTGEILTVFSIVNTITQFPEIDAAKILIDDNEIETLAGHLDVSIPIKTNENLIKK